MTAQEELFLKAAQNADMQAIKKLLPGIGTDVKNKAFIYTPSVDIACLLKEAGVDINAAAQGKSTHSMGYFEYIHPPLASACKENYTQKAQWLVRAGADLNKHWYEREFVAGMSNIDYCYQLTPLMWAVKNRNLPLIRFLAEAGADIHAKGHNGNLWQDDCTALEIAEEYSYGDYIEIANLLKAAGAHE